MNTNMKARRQRSPNWESAERKLLFELLTDYIDIIENKSTDNNTNKRKAETWQTITDRFNELNMRQRTYEEVKTQWRLCKVQAKKKIRSNDGSSPPSSDEDPLNIAKMVPVEFDDQEYDTDAPVILTPPESEYKNKITIIPTSQLKSSSTTTTIKKEFDSITKLAVKRPYPGVESLEVSRNVAAQRFVREEHEQRMAHMQELHQLKLQHEAEAHHWLREEHQLRMELLHKQLAEQ